MTRLRVCIVSDRLPEEAVGGGELSLAALIDALRDYASDSLDLHLVALSPLISEVETYLWHGLPVTVVPFLFDNSVYEPDRTRPRSRRPPRWALYALWKLPISRVRTGLLFAAHHLYYGGLQGTGVRRRWELVLNNLVGLKLDRSAVDHYDDEFDQDFDSTALRQAILATRPDVVHADNARSILRVAGFDLETPTVALVRDLRFFCPQRERIAHVGEVACERCDFACLGTIGAPWKGIRRRILAANLDYRQRALQRFTRVVTTSSFLATSLRELHLNVDVVPNRVEAARATSGDPSDHLVGEIPRLVFAGMLQENKGADLFVDMARELHRRGCVFEAVLCGRGRMREELEARVRAEGLTTKVRFLGHLPHQRVRAELSGATAAVCCTRWPEPFGRVPLEAYAVGTPAICSARGGFVEHVVPGVTGLLVEQPSAEAFATAAQILLRDPTRARTMGEAGRRWLEAHIRTDAIVARMVDIYRLAVGSNIACVEDAVSP